LNIDELARRAAEFQGILDGARKAIPDPGFEWYRYDSLGNFFTLERLLTGERRELLKLTEGLPILDIGCADGDIALFLSSLGCTVHAVDNPGTNCNGMAGVRRSKELLGAGNLEILERDVDDDLRPPLPKYGLALLLGVLYHLENPMRVLERLSMHARYLILSTRVARRSPDKAVDLSALPVAYLLGGSETNDDPTNFWIFTRPGLERLLARSGWRAVDWLSVGNTADSDPVTEAGDERAFVFAENARSPVMAGRMVDGWYDQEGWETWRWTAPEFSVEFPVSGDVLSVKLYVPENLGSATLSVRANGEDLPRREFPEPGHYEYVAGIPRRAAAAPLRIEFRSSRSFRPGNGDERDLGVVVEHVKVT
jgi:SAM-dependent methyltransferase